MATHPFLSDDWFTAVREIVDAQELEIPPHAELTMNLVVTDTPFGEDRLLHIGAKEGRADWGPGHAADADLTLTTDYVTARDIFISGNPQAGMQAFMEGKVKVQCHITFTKRSARELGRFVDAHPHLASTAFLGMLTMMLGGVVFGLFRLLHG